MGAATDSAYGYKDAVNKWYVTKLQEDNQYQLASSYTISSDGKLGDIVIPVSGDKPSGGYLNYSNNTLIGGCLVIGDYAVTFEGGNATSTIKGTCSENTQNENEDPDLEYYTIDEMCPNCVFSDNDFEYAQHLNQEITITATEEFNSYGNRFVGYILDGNNIIKRVFACGIMNDNAFCIEGGNPNKYSRNNDIVNHFYNLNTECEYDYDEPSIQCRGTLYTYVHQNGYVGVETGLDDILCQVTTDGTTYCG